MGGEKDWLDVLRRAFHQVLGVDFPDPAAVLNRALYGPWKLESRLLEALRAIEQARPAAKQHVRRGHASTLAKYTENPPGKVNVSIDQWVEILKYCEGTAPRHFSP
ncbi:hypothetical protein HY346_00265 [Candidatus Microgenomates bacterium]|nr:hypothetical protein [Candidatus Microgenomates bacterium]